MTQKAGTDRFIELLYRGGTWEATYLSGNVRIRVSSDPNAEFSDADASIFAQPATPAVLHADRMPAEASQAHCDNGPVSVRARRLMSGTVWHRIQCGQSGVGSFVDTLNGTPVTTADVLSSSGLASSWSVLQSVVGDRVVVLNIGLRLAGGGTTLMASAPSLRWNGTTCYPQASVETSDRPAISATCEASEMTGAEHAFRLSSVSSHAVLRAASVAAASRHRDLRSAMAITVTDAGDGVRISVDWPDGGATADLAGHVVR